MDAWFGGDVIDRFSLFGPSHIAMIALYLILLGAIIFSHRKIAANDTLKHMFRWSLAGLLIISVTSYHIWMVVNDSWRLGHSLPLHICSLSGILAIFALITNNKKLIMITFFLGFIPAGLTVITPEVAHGFPHYRFWQFFFWFYFLYMNNWCVI